MAVHVNGTRERNEVSGDHPVLNTMQPDAERPPTAEPLPDVKPAERAAPLPRAAPREQTPADLVQRLVEGRWLLLAVAAGAIALALLYLAVTPPRYASSILIQVESRSRPVAAFQELATLFQSETPTEGEMRIMKSRTLLEAVVSTLGLDREAHPRTLPLVGAAIARRHAGRDLAPARFGLERYAWGGETIRVKRLEVSDGLVEHPLTLTALEGARYRIAAGDGAVLAEGEVGVATTGTDGERSVELLVSELTARPGTEFTLLKHRRIDVIEALQGALQIAEQGRSTGVVEVALEGSDPNQVAAILDALAANYLRQTVERTSMEAAKTLTVLEAQLPVLKASVEKSERALNAFQRRNGTVNLTVEGQTMLERVMEIERAIAEAEVQHGELTRRFGERYPEVPIVAGRLERLKEQRGAVEARLRALPDLELESTRLSRQARVATELYLLVLNRAEELRIVKSGWVGNVRILERAGIPSRPARPRRGIVLTMGTLLGLLAGVALVLARDTFRRVANDPDEIEAGAGVPVLATIPHSAAQRRLARRARRGGAPVLSAAAPRDPAVEDLRSLRTSVQYALGHGRNNVVAVSGLAPGSGKSFLSVNLAHLLAAADGRVLLVDADLRRGGLHRQFGLEPQPGLADVLSGEASLDAVVKPTTTPRLDLLPAGTLPSNPAELLAGERAQQLFADLGRRYGVVVVDTPPILSVADSALVGRHAGFNLVVLRAGEHSVDEISYVVKRLARSGVVVRGAVLNDVRASRQGRGYHGYATGRAARHG